MVGREPSAHDTRVFQVGDEIAGRYRIRRFLGGGGMGEVYEAEDLELGAVIALKTIRAGRDDDVRTLERFRREILVSRAVAHPGVCRTFDLGIHRWRSEDAASRTLFFTMELLAGETLSAVLSRNGRLATDDALPLARQLASALGAAHAAGVVHRDFKPGNVILVEAAEQPGGRRAVITDFGLARVAAGAEGVADTESGQGSLVGTPAYMAPEQVAGGAVGPAADVYALGVVLFELVTGTVPFDGDGPMAIATRRLVENAPRASTRCPGLDPRWDETIARCLARDPAERFPRVDEVIAALEETPASAADDVTAALVDQADGIRDTGDRAERLSKRGRARRVLAWTGAVTAVAALALVSLWARGRAEQGPGATAAAGAAPMVQPVAAAEAEPAHPSVAVLAFANLSGRADDAWLGTALAEMLGTELAAGDRLRVMPRGSVERLAAAQGLTSSESASEEQLEALRLGLGARHVVTGSFVVVGQGTEARVRVDLQLRDGSSGEVRGVVRAEGKDDQILELVARLGMDLRGRLGVEELSVTEEDVARRSLPADLQAARAFAEGLAHMRAGDPSEARPFFEEAAAREPHHAPYHAAIAEVWAVLQYDQKAIEHARRAFELSAALPRVERLLVEAQYRKTSREWERATQIYESLWTFFPENVEYGLGLGEVQLLAGRAADLLKTVAKLREHAAAAGDPRVDVLEAHAATRQSDVARVRRAAGAAVAEARRRGAGRIEATAHHLLCRALTDAGDFEAATAACNDAAELYEAAHDQAGEAGVLLDYGAVLWYQSRGGEAERRFREALAVYRDIGSVRGMALATGWLATMAKGRGQLDDAITYFREALEQCRRIADDGCTSYLAANLAGALVEAGRSVEARALYDEAVAIGRRIDGHAAVALALLNQSWVLFDMGELPAAGKAADEAVTIYERLGDRANQVYALDAAGIMALAQADSERARTLLEKALAEREALGMPGGPSRQNLAEVDLYEGRLEDAARGAAQAVDELRAAGRNIGEAYALEVLTRIHLRAGRVDEATAAIERAVSLGADPATLASARARVLHARGRTAEARRMLAPFIRESRRRGQMGRALELELALGEVGLAGPDRAAGVRTLERVAKDLAARGYVLAARQAEELLRPATER